MLCKGNPKIAPSIKPIPVSYTHLAPPLCRLSMTEGTTAARPLPTRIAMGVARQTSTDHFIKSLSFQKDTLSSLTGHSAVTYIQGLHPQILAKLQIFMKAKS